LLLLARIPVGEPKLIRETCSSCRDDRRKGKGSFATTSGTGQKPTWSSEAAKSAFTPTADIDSADQILWNFDVRSTPKSGHSSGRRLRLLGARSRHRLHYSITASATASSGGGISKPSALAVLRFTISSNRVGCSIGRLPGFSPLMMRST
jgi:hypothetical protein